MKKTLSIIGVLAIITGIVLAIVVFGVGSVTNNGITPESFNTIKDWREIKREFNTSAVKSIIIDDSNNSIVVLPSPDDKIHVSVFESQTAKKFFDINVEDDTLNITGRQEFRMMLFSIDFSSVERHTTVLIPDGLEGYIDASTSNASCTIEDISCAGNIEITTSNAPITGERLSSDDKIIFTSSNSPISLLQSQAAETSLKTSNAGIVSQENSSAHALNLDNSNGRIKVIATTAGSAEIHTSNAGITLENFSVNGDIYARNSNAPIELDSIFADGSITLKTSNGPIRGSINDSRDNFTIYSSTSNGSNNLGSGGSGAKKLEADSSNASIDIEFLK